MNDGRILGHGPAACCFKTWLKSGLLELHQIWSVEDLIAEAVKVVCPTMSHQYCSVCSSVAAPEVLWAQSAKVAGLQQLHGSDTADDISGNGSEQDLPAEVYDNLEDVWTSNSIVKTRVLATNVHHVTKFSQLYDQMFYSMVYMDKFTPTSQRVTSTNALDVAVHTMEVYCAP